MESAFTDEQKEEEEENKCGAATGNAGRLKQLYNKTTAVTEKYDKVKSGYDSANKARDTVQKGHKWFKGGEVHPTPLTATQQLSKQAVVNMVSKSASILQVSAVTMKAALIVAIVTVVVVVPISVGVTYALSKCTSSNQQITSTISSSSPTTENDKSIGATIETGAQQTIEHTTTKASECDIEYTTAPANTTLPLRASSIDIPSNATWKQNGVTVAGGNGNGSGSNQLLYPRGLYVDDDQTIYIADTNNHRIMAWKCGAKSGEVVAGGNGQGNGTNQLNFTHDVIVDKERDSLIICDGGNRRVVRWSRRNGGDTNGETVISDVDCWGLTMDENGFLYIVEDKKDVVRRYNRSESNGTVVAGSKGRGYGLNQLSSPHNVFADRNHSVYVSDVGNHRVMKWEEGAEQGEVVAGGNGLGSNFTQLFFLQGVVVDQLGTVYVADELNNRIMRWPNGSTQGSVIAGGNDKGNQSNQLHFPAGLSFDRHGNLYVADHINHRVQKFEIE